VIALLAAFIGAYSPDQVVQYDYGWGFPLSEGFVIWMIVMVGFELSGVYMLTVTSLSTRDRAVRRQATLMSVGIASPYVYAIVISVMLDQGVSIPNTYSPGLLFLILIFAYSVLRYRVFIGEAAPRAETILHEDHRELGEMKGRLVMVEEKKSEKAFELFQGIVALGAPGLLVTRLVADLDEKGLRDAGITVLVLSSQVGEDRLDPSNLSILHHAVREYPRAHPSAVVLVDGVEYLFENNESDKVLKFFQTLRDEVIVSGASLLITVDPDTIEERHRSMFEREFEVAGPGKGAGTEI
jgi:hypothetical protein